MAWPPKIATAKPRDRPKPRKEQMTQKVYVILVHGQWYLATLALASDYSSSGDDHFEEPIWSELRTTAYICKHTEPEKIIRLPLPGE